jgi:hypothetical protein
MNEANTPSQAPSADNLEPIKVPATVPQPDIPQPDIPQPDTLSAVAPPALTANDSPQTLAEAIATIRYFQQREEQLTQRVKELEGQLEHAQKASPPSSEIPSSATPSSVPDRLSQEPERRQRMLVEMIGKKLETYQQRIAQMERECALTQQRYQEKNSQLQEAENACQELRSRLQRQQRHTLQFKAALEKCLDLAESQQYVAPDRSKAPLQIVLAQQAQPVKPWSSEERTPDNGTVPPIELVRSLLPEPTHNGNTPSKPQTPADRSPAASAIAETPEFQTNSNRGELSPPQDAAAESESPENELKFSPKRRQSLADLDLPSFPPLSNGTFEE